MKIRIVPVAAGLAAAAGIALTGASLASADTSTPAASTASYGASAPAAGEAPAAANGNTDPTKPMRSDETLLTGDVAARVTAAAKAKEPTATIERVETDSDGVYEAHMVRTDGTHIIVQVDKSYAVTAVQEGGAGGGPGARGGQGGAPSPSSGQASSSTAPSAS
ncbi:hypothetical protein [Pedococcus sp. 2YAF34]|uniref:hypothetical protein n=1 Tax=Pedococcus sp. 2YAF34 TaxID=3233032 RepID=UPI003F9DDE7A